MSSAATRTSWVRLLGAWAIFVATFVAWKFYQVEQAGNLFQFVAWVVAIVGIVIGWAPTKPTETVTPSTVGQEHATKLFAAIFVGVLAWYGHFVLAAFWLAGAAGSAIYRERFDSNGKFILKDEA